MTEQIRNPKLRFRDNKGNDYSPWNLYSIKDVAKMSSGKSKKNENKGRYIIMDMGTVTKNGTMLTHKSTPYESDLLNKGDLVMVKDDIGGGHIIGKTIFIPESQKYVLGDHVYRLEPKNYDGLFLHYCINSPIVNRSLKRKVTGSAQLGLNRKSVEEELIKIPSLEEQEKIGGFFSKLDQQIELEEKKLELLEQQKRGYMQKIFSQQLRFKDENGNDYPEWKKRKLDDVANYRRGSFPQPYGNKEWYDEKNGEPFVQVVDVDKNMKLHDKTKQKISDLAKPKSVKGFKGDIVVTLQGSIGRVAILQYDAYIDRTLLLINSFKIKMNKNYFNYVLYLLFLREKERAPGGTIKTITKAVLSNFEIDIPTLEEQNKIGMFFNEIDNLIELQNNKINHLKQRKQGLLQKMFV